MLRRTHSHTQASPNTAATSSIGSTPAQCKSFSRIVFTDEAGVLTINEQGCFGRAWAESSDARAFPSYMSGQVVRVFERPLCARGGRVAVKRATGRSRAR